MPRGGTSLPLAIFLNTEARAPRCMNRLVPMGALNYSIQISQYNKAGVLRLCHAKNQSPTKALRSLGPLEHVCCGPIYRQRSPLRWRSNRKHQPSIPAG
jgi:hypothetical protein